MLKRSPLTQKAVPSTFQIQYPPNTHPSVTAGNLSTHEKAREGIQINITDWSNKAGADSPLPLEAGKNQGRISKSFYTIRERDPVGERVSFTDFGNRKTLMTWVHLKCVY